MADGEANVGSIIGYLKLNRDDWVAGLAATKRDVSTLNGSNPDIRIKSNAADTVAQLATVKAATDSVGSSATNAGNEVQFNLIAALAAVAPAAIPIAGVAGGALVGLIPVIATVKLGIAGITNEYKDGSLAGTKYGADIDSLKGELTNLQTIAAGGILNGIDKALATSHGLFPLVNSDVKTMSGYIGEIIAGGAPALLKILTQLNPLFETFGHDVADGAQHLEDFATSSGGVTKFVTYVQAELPEVQQLLGELVVLFAHLVTAAAPFGGVLLTDITALVGVLDKIPVSVLQDAIPPTVALYVALKAYQGITAIIAGVNVAITSMKAPFTQTAAQATASQLATSSAVAKQAADAAVAAAEVAEAEAAKQTAMRESAAAAAQFGAAYDEVSADVVAAATAEAAALRAVADTAIATAAEIEASATAAADTAVAEGAVASAGWAAMLGPIGAVIIGVGLLASTMFNSTSANQAAAASQDAYSSSLKTSANALAGVNIAATNKQLSDAHALSQIDLLNSKNKTLGLTYGEVALAVNGSTTQFNNIISVLKSVAAANDDVVAANSTDSSPVYEYNAQGKAAEALIKTITSLRSNLTDAEKAQAELAAAQQEAQIITDGGTTAVAKQARAFGTTADAYLTAQSAAQQNTEATKSQTLAFQLENNAAGLVNQALQTMAGQNLSIAQAKTADAQATLDLTASLKTNGNTVSDNTAKGLANQQALEGKAASLRAVLSAEAAGSEGTAKATAEYNTNAAAILKQIASTDGANSATYKYAQQILKIPPVAKTQFDIDDAAAQKTLAQLNAALANLTRGTNYVKLQVSVGGATNAGLLHSIQAGNNAAGTEDWKGGLTWVAENGPELIQLPPHTKISNQAKTQQMLSGVAGVSGSAGAGGSADLADLTAAVLALANRPITLNGRVVTDGVNSQNRVNARR